MACRSFLTFLFLAAASAPIGQARAESVKDEAIAAEAQRRHDALIAEGYNLTHSWSFSVQPEKTTIRFELLVPPPEVEHTFSFWVETKEGELSCRLLGPDRNPRAVWAGRKGGMTVSFAAPAGTYAVEIEQPPGAMGRALLGVKGPALHRCEVKTGTVQERAASPMKGFYWPYILFVPSEVKSSHLLVVPNNTGFETEDLEFLRVSASCDVRRQNALAARLGVPLLVPLFPRPVERDDGTYLYLHALTRASLETKVTNIRRVDLQLLAMIDDARNALRESHVQMGAKVLLWGFSASGSFVNRFAMLHPERVVAVACGSPGGWPLAPVEKLDGEKLDYPVGVADVKALVGRSLDGSGLRQVVWFFFLGTEDRNDAVVSRDSFSKAQEELVFRRFGVTPASRWKIAEQLYAKAGLRAQFTLYPGAAHSVTPDMEKDVTQFFERACQGGVR